MIAMKKESPLKVGVYCTQVLESRNLVARPKPPRCVVKATDLVVWGGGFATHEIAIMGNGEVNFAPRGDSGALIMLKEEGKALKAAGLLHGINKMKHLALATPLQVVL